MWDKLNGASCRASFALSNGYCHHSGSSRLSDRIFQTVCLSSALPGDHIKFVKSFLIPTDSDAVFHEESEYDIGFKIRIKKVGLSSPFQLE